MSVDEVFGSGDPRKRVQGFWQAVSRGDDVVGHKARRALGLPVDERAGEYFEVFFPDQIRRGPRTSSRAPIVTDAQMSGRINPEDIPYVRRKSLSKAARKRLARERMASRQDPSLAQRARGGGEWVDETPIASPSPFQTEGNLDEPYRTGRNAWGKKVSPSQNAAKEAEQAAKQTSGARRVTRAAEAAEESRPITNRGTGRNIIREMTRRTRRAVDDIARFEVSDVKNLLRSTLRGVRRGKAYVDSHSFAEMLSDVESLINSSGVVDPKKALKSDVKVFRSIMSGLESGVNTPDRRFAYSMLDMIDDHDLLADIAAKIDPLGFQGVRKGGVVGKSAVKEFLRIKIDGAKKTDVVDEAIDQYTRNVTSVRVNKEGRESFARWVDQVMNGDEAWHNKGIERARRGEFHFNVGGISQTTHIGKDVTRRFDLSLPHEYRQVFNGMEVIGADGKVQSGVINGLGFTRESLRELEKASQAQASDVVGFNMHLMQQNKLEFMELARGRDALGRLKMGHVGNFVFQASAQQKQHFEHVSRHAFARQFQLDIETSYGRRRWANEVTKLRGLDTAAADESFDGIVNLTERTLHRNLALAVREGNVDSILEASKALRDSPDVNWITQIAMEEKGRVKGSSLGDFKSIERTKLRGFYRGEQNVGVFAGRHMEQADFDDAIRELVGERIRQARTGGVISGLNVEKFDMRIIREQAWRTGEEALAQSQKMRSALPAGEAASAELIALERRASLMLAYSGRWTGSSWIAHPDENTKRMVNVLNRRLGKVAFSYNAPIADTLQVSDITSNLVRPLAALAVERKAEDRVAIATGHIMEHFLGEKESGYLTVGGKKVKSLSLQVWGDRNQAVAERIESMFDTLDDSQLKQLIENTKKSNRSLDTGVSDFLQGLHSSRKAGDATPVAQKMMGEFSDDQMHGVMDALKTQWGKEGVAEAIEGVKGAPASQESLMYSVKDVWNKMKGGFLDTDGELFLSKAAHQARRDLRMIDVAEELSFAAFRNTGKFIGATMAKPTKAIIDFASSVSVSLPFVGVRGTGEELLGKVGALLPKLNGEEVLQGEFAQYAAGQIAATREKARGMIGRGEKYLSTAMESQARQIKSIIGGEVELAKIQKGLRFGYAGLAVAGIAAGAFVAGTIHKRAHQDDESWKYGEFEDPKARKLLKQRMAEVGAGQMVTEMSKRKNYSYNMSPNKHDHLFRG